MRYDDPFGPFHMLNGQSARVDFERLLISWLQLARTLVGQRMLLNILQTTVPLLFLKIALSICKCNQLFNYFFLYRSGVSVYLSAPCGSNEYMGNTESLNSPACGWVNILPLIGVSEAFGVENVKRIFA